ncbi:hypothetical protein PN462_10195 [Spirulina sp. CS-785/01]|uniref:hypothetical protein n=1 Tax=Spirulina sp. CS-785/01 TaxID=3021716 RepID=UPI00232F7B3E|nr:hypothetical protein [Spirulina sp. CS-785/01]MDB9313468.1 hypothetical protein [Spirulina sp. CS-785/01]
MAKYLPMLSNVTVDEYEIDQVEEEVELYGEELEEAIHNAILDEYPYEGDMINEKDTIEQALNLLKQKGGNVEETIRSFAEEQNIKTQELLSNAHRAWDQLIDEEWANAVYEELPSLVSGILIELIIADNSNLSPETSSILGFIVAVAVRKYLVQDRTVAANEAVV